MQQDFTTTTLPSAREAKNSDLFRDGLVILNRKELYKEAEHFRKSLRSLLREPWVVELRKAYYASNDSRQQMNAFFRIEATAPAYPKLVLTKDGFRIHRLDIEKRYQAGEVIPSRTISTFSLFDLRSVAELTAIGANLNTVRKNLIEKARELNIAVPDQEPELARVRSSSQSRSRSSIERPPFYRLTDQKIELIDNEREFEFEKQGIQLRASDGTIWQQQAPGQFGTAISTWYGSKLSHRINATKFSSFAQPNFFASYFEVPNARFRDKGDTFPLKYCHIPYSEMASKLDLEEVTSHLQAGNQIKIGPIYLDHLQHGYFRTYTSRRELKDIVKPLGSKSIVEGLQTSLETLSKLSGGALFWTEDREKYMPREDFIEALARQEEECYIKPLSTSGGGIGVFSMQKKKGGAFTLKTNCPLLGSHLHRLNGFNKKHEVTAPKIEFNAREKCHLETQYHAPCEFTEISFRNSEELKDRLSVLFSKLQETSKGKMNAWICESTIPMERLGKKRVEFRILFTRDSMDQVQLCAHYVKVSDAEISGNISLGGHGAESLDTLQKLIEQRFPEASSVDIGLKARNLLYDLLIESKDYVEKLDEDYQDLADVWEEVSGGLKLRNKSIYCVDIALCFNEDKAEYEWNLIETQHGAAITGLEDIYPEAAARFRDER